MIRSISVSRPTTGSSLPSAASLVRLRPNWSSSFEDFLPSPCCAGLARAALAAAGAGEHADDLVADLLGVGVEVEQDAGGDALVLAHEAEQDVLGADVVVAERERLAQRELEHLLRARRERDLPGGDLLAGADDADDLGADALHGDVERLEHARGETLLLAEQAEQDVLGADVVVLEDAGLLLGEDDHLAGPFGEALEHCCGLFCRVLRGRAVPESTFPLHRHLRQRDEDRWSPDLPESRVYQRPSVDDLSGLIRLSTLNAGSHSRRSTAAGGPAQVRIAGKSTTSRIELRPLRIITSRSMPTPMPPVGGIPCSSART